MRQKKKIVFRLIPYYFTLSIILFIAVFPMLWMTITSLKPAQNVVASEQSIIFTPTFENYSDLLLNKQVPFLRYFANSIIISLTSTALAVGFASMAGYALARIKPKGHKILSLAILSMRMLPPIVLVIPLYIIFNQFGWLDNVLTLILPYTALNLPLATWMLRSFFISLPGEIDEAATVDGANSIQTFTRIMLPLTAPGLSATAIYSFSLAWNDFLIALPLTTSKAITLPILASIVRTDEGIEWASVGCIVVIMIIPTVLFTFFSQKSLVRGITSGAVKG